MLRNLTGHRPLLRMTSTGVPRLHLDSLGGRSTPRSGASRQQALQRVFKGLDDDDDYVPPSKPTLNTSIAAPSVNDSVRSSTYSTAPSMTPRASRDEIERRRKVMFDSDDEDNSSQPVRFSKVCFRTICLSMCNAFQTSVPTDSTLSGGSSRTMHATLTIFRFKYPVG